MAELYLNDNQLVKLPQLFIPKLKKLDVSYNSLSSIDDFVKSQLHHLVELYLNDNKFKRIPPLKYVPKLKKIDLCYNEIRKLDEFMKGDYPQLTDFYFTENMITSVPKMNTPKIQSLHLDSNDI
jgi:Leucine-rich repeat (LRR) protein